MPYAPPGLRPEKTWFLVRGVRHEPAPHSSPMVGLLRPYFASREDVLVVTDSSGAAGEALLEISRIFGEGRVCLAGAAPSADAPCDHIVLDHSVPPGRMREIVSEHAGRAHIGIFLEYSDLERYKAPGCAAVCFSRRDSDWLRALADSVAGSVGLAPGAYTLLATPPPVQTVEFVFAQNADLKIRSVQLMGCPPGTCVLRRGPAGVPIPNCTYVDGIAADTRCRKLLVVDLDVGAVREALLRFHDVTLFYDPGDFARLGEVAALCDEHGVPVPEHIRRMAAPQ